jgi:periplasmic divalent cation tolerance protein
MKNGYCMVVTTAPDREEAERLAEGILDSRLAACVQMAGIRSFFLWDGALQRENEIVLFIKTTDQRYDDLETYIHRYHPYDVPEIIRLPVTGGLSGYLGWLDSMTSPPGPLS